MIEIASALARREREGAFTTAERDRAVRRLNADLAAYVLVELSPELCADAQGLVLRYALRSGDAVQLASLQFTCATARIDMISQPTEGREKRLLPDIEHALCPVCACQTRFPAAPTSRTC